MASDRNPYEIVVAALALFVWAAAFPDTPKFWAAVIGAAFALIGTWVLGNRAARKNAQDDGKDPPTPGKTLRAGWYVDFGELERACEELCERVNAREHRVTRRAPC